MAVPVKPATFRSLGRLLLGLLGYTASSAWALSGCGSDGSTGASGGAAGGSAGTSWGGAGTGGAGSGGDSGAPPDGGDCQRPPGAADFVRKVVLAHPYDASQKPADAYEVLTLDTSGKLSKTGVTFSMGRAVDGEIVFTPDGELGFVATDKGTLGVFRFEPDGTVTVLNAGLTGGFYASKLVMSPGGDRLYVLDSEWRDIGGGIYSLKINCDDSLEDEGLVAAAKLPSGFAFLANSPGQVVAIADDILDSPTGQHAHLLDWGLIPKVLTSIQAFSADDPIINSFAVTADEELALLGDGSGFSSVPNRVAVVSLAAGTLAKVQELSPIEDPADIETSPHDKTALVASGFGDELFVLRHDAGKPSAPYSFEPLAYAGAKPQLPVTMVQIRRGGLVGHVLVGEVSAVRQVELDQTLGAMDLGPFDMGSGVENIVGAIGVQP